MEVLVGDLYMALLRTRDLVGGGATVRANQVMFGSNTGETLSVVRVREGRVAETVPDGPAPGPVAEVMLGDDVWQDPTVGEDGCRLPDLREGDDPARYWERQTGPCATVDEVISQLGDIPMSWRVCAVWAQPTTEDEAREAGRQAVEGAPDFHDPEMLEGLVAALTMGIGGQERMCLFPGDPSVECAPTWYYLPEEEVDRRGWVRPDGSPLPPGERPTDECKFRVVGRQTIGPFFGWETGHRACHMLQVWC